MVRLAKKRKSNKRVYLMIGIFTVFIALFLVVAKSVGWLGKEKAKKVLFSDCKQVTIVEKVSASGKVQPVEEVKISPEVSGEIKEIYISEGDSVTEGHLLIKIRPDNLQAALDRAIASLNTQKANYAQSKARLAQQEASHIAASQSYERSEDLHEQNVISQQDYENAKRDYEVAQASLEAAEQNLEAARYTVLSAEATVDESRKNLALTQIYAPMSGIVTRLDVEKGERVVGTQTMAGTEMLRIANLNTMEVRVDVNENDIIKLSIGDTAVIDIDSYSFRNEKFTGTVYAIANSANIVQGVSDAVTEFEVKILLLPGSYKHLLQESNSPSPFRPGMTASVDVITETRRNVLSVPLTAVTVRNPQDNKKSLSGRGGQNNKTEKKGTDRGEAALQEVVFVYDEKTSAVDLINVKTGVSDFENIEILEGIELGQQVVRGPFRMVSEELQSGDLVENIEIESKRENEEKKES